MNQIWKEKEPKLDGCWQNLAFSFHTQENHWIELCCTTTTERSSLSEFEIGGWQANRFLVDLPSKQVKDQCLTSVRDFRSLKTWQA